MNPETDIARIEASVRALADELARTRAELSGKIAEAHTVPPPGSKRETPEYNKQPPDEFRPTVSVAGVTAAFPNLDLWSHYVAVAYQERNDGTTTTSLDPPYDHTHGVTFTGTEIQIGGQAAPSDPYFATVAYFRFGRFVGMSYGKSTGNKWFDTTITDDGGDLVKPWQAAHPDVARCPYKSETDPAGDNPVLRVDTSFVYGGVGELPAS